jgi:hypothetical protein
VFINIYSLVGTSILISVLAVPDTLNVTSPPISSPK